MILYFRFRPVYTILYSTCHIFRSPFAGPTTPPSQSPYPTKRKLGLLGYNKCSLSDIQQNFRVYRHSLLMTHHHQCLLLCNLGQFLCRHTLGSCWPLGGETTWSEELSHCRCLDTKVHVLWYWTDCLCKLLFIRLGNHHTNDIYIVFKLPLEPMQRAQDECEIIHLKTI